MFLLTFSFWVSKQSLSFPLWAQNSNSSASNHDKMGYTLGYFEMVIKAGKALSCSFITKYKKIGAKGNLTRLTNQHWGSIISIVFIFILV